MRIKQRRNFGAQDARERLKNRDPIRLLSFENGAKHLAQSHRYDLRNEYTLVVRSATKTNLATFSDWIFLRYTPLERRNR
jgi:hypothetical protein